MGQWYKSSLCGVGKLLMMTLIPWERIEGVLGCLKDAVEDGVSEQMVVPFMGRPHGDWGLPSVTLTTMQDSLIGSMKAVIIEEDTIYSRDAQLEGDAEQGEAGTISPCIVA
jgi:hypothetical protein